MKVKYSKNMTKFFILFFILLIVLMPFVKNIIRFQNSILTSYDISDNIIISLKPSQEKLYGINLVTWLVKEYHQKYISVNTKISLDEKNVDPYNSKAYLYHRDLYFWDKKIYSFSDDYPSSLSSILWTKNWKYLIKTDMKDYYFFFWAFHKKFANIILSITELQTWKTSQIFAKNEGNEVIDVKEILGYID